MQTIFITVLLLVSTLFAFTQDSSVKEFSAKGVLVDVQTLFTKAKDAKETKVAVDASKLLTSYVVLVNAKGVYSFLEREENEKFLKDAKIGDFVEIKGKVLETGFLVEIESLNVLKEKSDVDLKPYQEEAGKAISLDGTNKCQCGLKVGDLKHSCKLGHLHHLQTEDGKIYHYLEPDKSKDMKLHFKKMKVEVLLFSGNYIKIKEEAKQ
jgi:hypothetical protein